MSQWKIIESLCSLMVEQDLIDRDAVKEESDELSKWTDILDKYMEGDKKFHEIFFNYDLAECMYEGAMCHQYYRQGFLCGARLIMEICGFEREEN